MQEMVLSAINIYPIKSLGGIALREAKIEPRGLQYDRRWLLIGQDNVALTQRDYSRMALCSIRLRADALEVSAPGMKPLLIPFVLPDTPATATVKIWKSVCDAVIVGEFADEWFGRFLGASCRLVYMPDETRREVNPDYAVKDDIVSFADGYPFHLLGESSLEDLNGRLDSSLPMNRFRPNFVVNGSPAYTEDGWRQVRIGSTLFHVVKPCERCAVTTIDQTAGERAGQEPLTTLARYRASGNNLLFGQYLIADAEGGILRVGDRLQVIERRNGQQEA
ncbi:MAG: MOSC N-terminal beta barrel domain-containing protein [Pyrinomonadaceae bacterium]